MAYVPLIFLYGCMVGRIFQLEICESCIYLRKSMPPYITSAKTYQQLTGMFCNMACHHDHVSDYRAQPPASDFMFCPGSLPANAFLPDHSQDVIGQDCQFQYQFVGFKFAEWQPPHIHISLDLTVELFTFAVGMKEADDFTIRHPKACPKGIDLCVVFQKELPIFIKDNGVHQPALVRPREGGAMKSSRATAASGPVSWPGLQICPVSSAT